MKSMTELAGGELCLPQPNYVTKENNYLTMLRRTIKVGAARRIRNSECYRKRISRRVMGRHDPTPQSQNKALSLPLGKQDLEGWEGKHINGDFYSMWFQPSHWGGSPFLPRSLINLFHRQVDLCDVWLLFTARNLGTGKTTDELWSSNQSFCWGKRYLTNKVRTFYITRDSAGSRMHLMFLPVVLDKKQKISWR